jgi:hypothetical protein
VGVDALAVAVGLGLGEAVGEGLGLGEGEGLGLGEGLAVVPQELLIYLCVHLVLLRAVALLVWVRA